VSAVELELAEGPHDITPVKGSGRQLDGTLADLTRPMDFPVEALRLVCGLPIRCERWFLVEFRHIDRFSAPTRLS
jgi:hypothetical protein